MRDPIATIIEDGTVAVTQDSTLGELFDALPDVPHGGVKSIEVYDAGYVGVLYRRLTLAQNWMALLVNGTATKNDPGFHDALRQIEDVLLERP